MKANHTARCGPKLGGMALGQFQPLVAKWFSETLGTPSPPQVRGWPAIASGKNVLIAAPTGTGKTMAAFLHALDQLLARGDELEDATRVLYVSPLRALSNDVRKNLQAPLAELRERDPSLPEVRVAVRTGDTTPSQRQKMLRKAPHILVSTPESLYLLLTSAGGRGLLKNVETVIVDEIHALARDRRGSHLALSLERLDALCDRPPQRIGLSATQRPLEKVARLLVGERPCELVDLGHLREIELDVIVPPSPLSSVCSHEQWSEIYAAMAELIRARRTTLVFVGTRKLAERLSARLSDELGKEFVGCHHGSLSRERRLDAEDRLKCGELSVLVATASLELGLDVGQVDLVIQVGSARSIATLLQRVGRAGHGVDRKPAGRIFPLTRDEAVEAAALVGAIRAERLDRTPEPPAAIDILAQQIVAECAARPEGVCEDELFERFRRAGPYLQMERKEFERAIELHLGDRWSLLHRDAVGRRLVATRRARLPALTSGGAIPDNADYEVRLVPEDTFIGTVNEDFAIEASAGDIFQLGNSSWRVVKVERGRMRVADAQGLPPNLPFWLGEGPARTRELSQEISDLRRELPSANELAKRIAIQPTAAKEVCEYLAEGAQALGGAPTQSRLVAERFHDESGGMQLILHSPYGARINRSLGLLLRKRICRGFGFELQAAADEEAILISLGPMHGFRLADVKGMLLAPGAEKALTQALLTTPMFEVRWRWNATRSLLVPRAFGGARVAPPILRMRADDLLAGAFPEVVACGENLPAGDLPLPDHALVEQTIQDCLTEALDLEGMQEVLAGLRDGSIEFEGFDLPGPSPFARGILSAGVYAFLDDAPLEERRVQAVQTRQALDPAQADKLGALDAGEIERVRAEAWPDPRDAEELHEVLGWMGYAQKDEFPELSEAKRELQAAGRIELRGERWFAVEAPASGARVLLGRLEALGPLPASDPLFEEFAAEILELEGAGKVLQTRIDGATAWCERGLLARIQRRTVEGLRRASRPVPAAAFLRFLADWQHLSPKHQLDGPRGVAEVLAQLSGFQAGAASWEDEILPARVRGYRKSWLDELCLSGEITWGRLFGSGDASPRSTPIALLPRADVQHWSMASQAADTEGLNPGAANILEHLRARGASFETDFPRAATPLASQREAALAQLVARGHITCDGFAALRRSLQKANQRARRERSNIATPVGRWSLWPRSDQNPDSVRDDAWYEFTARSLLARWGVVFRKLCQREALGLPWREMRRALRRLELAGEVRGGRFVTGFAGEQFALPAAVTALRRRAREAGEALTVSAADPLNLSGILTPDERVGSSTKRTVNVLEACAGEAPEKPSEIAS